MSESIGARTTARKVCGVTDIINGGGGGGVGALEKFSCSFSLHTHMHAYIGTPLLKKIS